MKDHRRIASCLLFPSTSQSKPLCAPAGVGGNLVAVQASRISTFLHMNGMPGENSEQAPRRCPSPCTTFFSPGNDGLLASLEGGNLQ